MESTHDPIIQHADLLAHCAQALKVLAHPMRLQILALLEKERLTVGQITALIGITQAETSQHLIKMRQVELIDVSREGRSAYYFITQSSCGIILNCIRKQISNSTTLS